jgi:hypothetical protein
MIYSIAIREPDDLDEFRGVARRLLGSRGGAGGGCLEQRGGGIVFQ